MSDRVGIMSIKGTIELFKTAYADWRDDKASRLAAALAYYSAISLAPLLIIILGIAGLVLSKEAATGQVAAQIERLIGSKSAQVIEDIIANASQPTESLISTIVGTLILLIGASGVFGALQDGLNTIWEVKPKEGRGILGLIKDRFLSLAMVLGVGFLLLVSLVLSAAVAAVGGYLGGLLPCHLLYFRS